jgi:hypothetical protein
MQEEENFNLTLEIESDPRNPTSFFLVKKSKILNDAIGTNKSEILELNQTNIIELNKFLENNEKI